MQRCQSGRSCSLGTAVYGNVPRVQIPVSAPKTEHSGVLFFVSDRCVICTRIDIAIDLNLYSSLANASIHAPKYARLTRIDKSLNSIANRKKY